ncbi:MAG: methyltransferase domain-containing protein [Acidobacteriota bacterium]|nr:methyltransferase domain-containing protein [Acidobacteriota bacterium]
MTVPLDPDARFVGIDQAYARHAHQAPPERRWLLVQTIVSALPRRTLIGSLPIRPGARVLDLGCGFGAASLEIAALSGCSVVGLDTDLPVLTVARAIADEVDPGGGAGGGGAGGSAVSFAVGDAYRLPFPDRSFDMVFSRFVFQHLSQAEQAASEVTRVLVPGGLACIVDVDDGLSISEPPPSLAFERLAKALQASQTSYGGDRRIGRRLPAILDRAGLVPNPVLVLPQAAYHRPEPGDPERLLMLERLGAARPGIVGGGHMTAEEFEADLAAFAAEAPGPTCEIEAHLAVLATRP